MCQVFSLSEIDAQCRKAVRGAGYPWGMAEEAGKVARWLAARGLPGPEAMAGWLSKIDGVDVATVSPIVTREPWRSKKPILCPIATGAALNDRAHLLIERGKLEIGPVGYPLLLVAQAGKIAEATGQAIEISWDSSHFLCAPDCIAPETGDTELAVTTDHVLCAVSSDVRDLRMERIGSRMVPDAVWNVLEHFAHRTYAPASEQSRLSGAGAGTRDVD